MTSILVTGATGHLGRLAVDALLARGVDPASLAALVRDADRGRDLADLGVDVRVGSYDDPESLDVALKGIDRLLFVSGSEVGRRAEQHRNVVDAAVRAGVGFVAYTSITRADSSPLGLAPEHLATEQALAASGLPHVLLRNSWYVENYTGQAAQQLEHGVVLGAAGEGRVSAATRADYAEAAAVAVLSDDLAGQVLELGADEAFTLAAYAATLSEAAGAPVTYRDLSVDDYTAALVGAGLPEGYARLLAESDAGLRDGALLVETGDLSRLLGRPTTPLVEAVRSALA